MGNQEFCINQEIVIEPIGKRAAANWKDIKGKKAKIISMHAKAAIVELNDCKELFVLLKKDIRRAN
jgi:hypothetical protein